MALSQVLQGVPFLAGYEGQRELNDQRGMQKIAQASQLMQILNQAAAQKEAQRRAAMLAQYQAGMRPDMTPEERVSHAAQFVTDPKDVLHYGGQQLEAKARREDAKTMLQQKFEEQRSALREKLEAQAELAKQRSEDQKLSQQERLQARADMIRLAASLRQPKEERPVAIMGENGPTYVRPGDAIGKQPYSPSIAGAGQFTPQALEFTAKQYLSGDRQAVLGFARNATARIALQNAIVDEAKKQGMSPPQVAAQIADFAGTLAGSRTVGQRAANISLASTEAQEMLGIVKETSDKFSRTKFVPWNMALKAYESGTGSPEIAEFGAAVNALVNVYARAINPTGVPTVSDKEHARSVLNTVQSPQQVDAVLGIINRELEIAKKAPRAVQEATRQRVIGEDKPAPTSAPTSGWTPEKEQRYQELLRKKQNAAQ